MTTVNRTLEEMVAIRKRDPEFPYAAPRTSAQERYRAGLRQLSRYVLRQREGQFDAVQQEGLEAIIDLAVCVHGKQRRKIGLLYLTHPLELARSQADIGVEWEEIIVAVLHDAGEERIDRDARIRELSMELRREPRNAEEIRQKLIQRSAKVAKEFLKEVGETLEGVLKRKGVSQELVRDRYRRRIERIQYCVYQMTRLAGVSEGEYLNRLLYGKRKRTSGRGEVPIYEDLQNFIRDPKEHPFDLYHKQTANLKLKDNIRNIRETPRRYEDHPKGYTVAHMNYLVFKYTGVLAAFRQKLNRLKRDDVQRQLMDQNIAELEWALREENTKDIAFLKREVLTPAEQRTVQENVQRYFRTREASRPHKPRYNWRDPAEAVSAMGAVYRRLMEGKAIGDPFFPIEGYTWRNHLMMLGDKRWLWELGHVRRPKQQRRNAHLIVYQDALMNRYSFDTPIRHRAYLDVVFGRRWPGR